jgi:hypothetical protein
LSKTTRLHIDGLQHEQLVEASPASCWAARRRQGMQESQSTRDAETDSTERRALSARRSGMKVKMLNRIGGDLERVEFRKAVGKALSDSCWRISSEEFVEPERHMNRGCTVLVDLARVSVHFPQAYDSAAFLT